MFSSEGSSGGIHITPFGIDNTVSAKWFGTVGSANAWQESSSSGVGVVVVAPIALFIEVGNVVTAARPEAVETASASSYSLGSVVVVDGYINFTDSGNSVVALFTWLKTGISTFGLARTSTAGTFPPDTLIASFTSINNTVSAIGENTVGSAGLAGSNVDGTSVAFFAVFVISHTVTTSWKLAVGSAAVRNVGIVCSLIALFSPIRIVNFSSAVAALASESGRESWDDSCEESVITSSTAVEEKGNSCLFSSSSVVKIQLHFEISVSSLDGVLTG